MTEVDLVGCSVGDAASEGNFQRHTQLSGGVSEHPEATTGNNQ